MLRRWKAETHDAATAATAIKVPPSGHTSWRGIADRGIRLVGVAAGPELERTTPLTSPGAPRGRPATSAFCCSITLGLSARVVGTQIGFRKALSTVAYANFAETLPIPGGALVRGAALMGSGASLGQATSVVTLTAILTLCLLASLSAAALAILGTSSAWLVLAVTLAGLLVSLAAIRRRAGTSLTLSVLGVRLLTAAIGAVSVYLALATLSEPSAFIEAVILTVSASLGAAVAIVPAGVGISESIAAGLAALTSVAPAAAFLAIALHRALGLLASLAIVGILRLLR